MMFVPFQALCYGIFKIKISIVSTVRHMIYIIETISDIPDTDNSFLDPLLRPPTLRGTPGWMPWVLGPLQGILDWII